MTNTPAVIDGAWTLQSQNTALEGRQHDGAFLTQANPQVASPVPMQTWRGGVIGSTSTAGILTDFYVLPEASPSLSVQVYPGSAVVNRAGNAVYVAYSTSIVHPVASDANATNPRLDALVLRVRDTALSDPGPLGGDVEFIDGTPAASPVLPTIPAGCLLIAAVRVNALATTIVGGNITLMRKSAALNGTVRRFMDTGAGDLLADVGFRDGELRDTGTTLDRWKDGTGWVTILTYADSATVVVGGNRYVTGTTLATTSSGTEILTATGTGNFPVVNGQAYEIEWGFAHQLSIGTDVFKIRIRDTNVSGAIQLEDDIQNEPINQPLVKTYKFLLKPTATTTRNFVGTFSRLSGTGGLDSKADATGRSYFKVTRLGPASLITDV
jgi:hypothetical protein